MSCQKTASQPPQCWPMLYTPTSWSSGHPPNCNMTRDSSRWVYGSESCTVGLRVCLGWAGWLESSPHSVLVEGISGKSLRPGLFKNTSDSSEESEPLERLRSVSLDDADTSGSKTAVDDLLAATLSPSIEERSLRPSMLHQAMQSSLPTCIFENIPVYFQCYSRGQRMQSVFFFLQYHCWSFNSRELKFLLGFFFLVQLSFVDFKFMNCNLCPF